MPAADRHSTGAAGGELLNAGIHGEPSRCDLTGLLPAVRVWVGLDSVQARIVGSDSQMKINQSSSLRVALAPAAVDGVNA